MRLMLCQVCSCNYSGPECDKCSLKEKLEWHQANTKPPEKPKAKTYAHYLTVNQYFDLDHACKILGQTFHYNTYLVGSVLTKPNFRDVDLRCMLDDEDYDKLFMSPYKDLNCDHMRQVFNISISAWLKSVTGLPIDFQFQKTSEANKEYPDQPRSCVGLVVKGKL